MTLSSPNLNILRNTLPSSQHWKWYASISKTGKTGSFIGQGFSPLHSAETPVNRVFGVSNRVFAFSDQVLVFLHQEFALLTSFQPKKKSNLYVIFTSFWHYMLHKLCPKIEFLHFSNRVFDKNRVSCIFSKSSFCGNAQK